MSKPDYTDLDYELTKAIQSSPRMSGDFLHIEGVAQALKPLIAANHSRPARRVIDGRLQALRRKGAIQFTRMRGAIQFTHGFWVMVRK